MNHCAIQENTSFSVADRRDSVVCPKPRRVNFLNGAFNDHLRPVRWHFSHQAELCDSKSGTDLLDIILAKLMRGRIMQGGYGGEQMDSSPPFYCGSPPSRVSNPLIQDARFGDEKQQILFSPLSPLPSGVPGPATSGNTSPSSPSSARKGVGCVRSNFGNKPAVRVEGFDCLDRDRHNCSIPALA
ncbi:hypothetical protein RJ641_003304 [Dillenia turbinata]|uniref:Uncharacterized protein n=1 Tax=Dillenia turbinata TaxID=194707 RepID=A0AAN8VKQ9_9MAGN